MKSSLQIALFGAALLAASAGAQSPLRGVNIAGAEFGEGTIPGDFNTHYTFNSEETFAYFADRGLPLLRVPIRWERIQREPFGELDADYLNGLQGNIAWAKAHGARVLIDVHNYGRYKLEEGGSRTEYVLDNRYGGEIKVSSEALADLWLRLSQEFRDEPDVHGYGLMNEPHDMGQASWKAISQKVLSAIRTAGDLKTIYVGGDSWSSAERWPATHGPEAWIDDPAQNTVYEAHLYFDQDASGRYFQGFDQELAANPNLLQVGRTRLQPFWDWCRSNDVRCFVGEYGVPGSDGRWLTVLDNLLSAMDEAGMGGTYWAAGDWWGDYALSAQPAAGVDKPQMQVLLNHRGPAFATGVSAASFAAGPLAPGSLASIFGEHLADALLSAQSLPLPTELAGSRAELRLPDGSARALDLVFVSPNQINCLLPAPLPNGVAELRVFRNEALVAIDNVVLAPAAPALFAANGTGTGPAAGQILRVSADGKRELELLASFEAGSQTYTPRPISFQTPGDRIFVIFYGTGFRNASAGSKLLWNDAPGPALVYAGEQPDFPGLDQANVEVPPEMAGTGEASIRLVADGRASNALTVVLE